MQRLQEEERRGRARPVSQDHVSKGRAQCTIRTYFPACLTSMYDIISQNVLSQACCDGALSNKTRVDTCVLSARCRAHRTGISLHYWYGFSALNVSQHQPGVPKRSQIRELHECHHNVKTNMVEGVLLQPSRHWLRSEF